MTESVLYTAMSWAAIALGYGAGLLMWRNALRWRGRKIFLRMLSGAACFYIATSYLALELLALPDERYLTSILIRPALVVLLALAAAFAIADY